MLIVIMLEPTATSIQSLFSMFSEALNDRNFAGFVQSAQGLSQDVQKISELCSALPDKRKVCVFTASVLSR
jgi:hypothetical protein